MTQPNSTLFTLALRHLTADGKKAGAELPKAQLSYISTEQLLTLLKSINAIAPGITYPAEPEVRISGGAGEFVVRVTGGQLHLVSWSKAHKGGVVTPDQVIAAVTGEGGEEQTQVSRKASAEDNGWRSKLTLVAMGAAIVAVNGFTVWFLTRPPRSLTADYRPLAAERAERVLAEVAGIYETGKKPGDRRIEIVPPKPVQRIKFGASGTTKEVQTFEVKPVESGGNLALLTSRKSLIKIKDNISVVLYGDTYTRVTN
jgi:hypothetical protein